MLKKFLIEQYDPLYMSGDCKYIMKEEIALATGFFLHIAMPIGFVILGIVAHPAWLIGIMTLGLAERPIQRKRQYIGSKCEVEGWFNEKIADTNESYKNQLLVYMDHLRNGGYRITDIEQELRHWVYLEKKYETQKIELEKQQIAEQMSRKEQINEYEKMLKEITQ